MKDILPITFFLFLPVLSIAQNHFPVIKSGTPVISIRDGRLLKKNSWRIDPSAKPDIYQAMVTGRSQTVTFITDTDSVSFKVKAGGKYFFIILLNNKDSAQTLIEGVRRKEKAIFDSKYIAAHEGKTIVEIPEIYELFNIVLALTATGLKEKWLVNKETAYYREVLDWFSPYQTEPVVSALDSALKKNQNSYHKLKMESYCFEMTQKGKIRNSKVFDRMWGDENSLRKYIPGLQAFADKSGFRNFYKLHQSLYSHQIAFYRDSANVPGRIAWLRKNFPRSDYNCFKIIFSPLVHGGQSAQGFENRRFREAQAHVNFPYRTGKFFEGFSEKAAVLLAGNFVFTELNHNFINPEAEQPEYSDAIQAAFSDLEKWIDTSNNLTAGYRNPLFCFNEYMNWVLVSLLYIDVAPAAELDKMLATIDQFMIDRGFKKFREFSHFTVTIYTSRKNGQTIADLYPQLMEWIKSNRNS